MYTAFLATVKKNKILKKIYKTILLFLNKKSIFVFAVFKIDSPNIKKNVISINRTQLNYYFIWCTHFEILIKALLAKSNVNYLHLMMLIWITPNKNCLI